MADQRRRAQLLSRRSTIRRSAATSIRAQEMARYVEAAYARRRHHRPRLDPRERRQRRRSSAISSTRRRRIRPTRWVLVVPTTRRCRSPRICAARRVATELVNYTQRFFAERGIDVEVEFSWGATEAKAAEGLVDAIVEVTETGSTLRANGLRIVAELFSSNPQLIANHERDGRPVEAREDRADRLAPDRARSAPRRQVGIKLNVPKEQPRHDHRDAAEHHRTDGVEPLRQRTGSPSRA